MPLILISGYPSSGKTHRANQLVSQLNAKIRSSSDASTSRLIVCHINDQSLGISRDVYREARTEKEARGAQYSAIKRALGRDTIVVADGLNYIKGFRYQLYCEAKALKTPSCVVHIGTPIDKCREINTMLVRDEERDGGYEKDVFDNLIYRYEEPNGMTRWDSPLFTVPFDDEAPPYEDIWEAMIGSEGKAKVVKPNTATAVQPATDSDYLYELDKSTQEILTTILDWQKDHPGEGGQDLALAEGDVVELPATAVSLPQLQRIRRQFISVEGITPFQ
ncbi:hypothetical protein G7Y79_00001g000520 [Physcia stellaris]|nr:hypothetical protein G7Y79_00001g000520 [Physcia stellaris]